MCAGEGAPPVHRVRSGSAIDSLLRRGALLRCLAGVSVWDAEPSRSERRGSESRLRIYALSSRAVFAITAVALLLPTLGGGKRDRLSEISESRRLPQQLRE